MHGTGSHDKTDRHCLADDPNGKIDIPRASAYWLRDAASRGMKHICWDGCIFSNEVLEIPSTWQHILEAMIKVEASNSSSPLPR